MPKENQRSRLTKTLLRNAYLDLLSDKKTGHITVTDLCNRAELNRTTFYLHFQEPNDVLKSIEDEIIENTRKYLIEIGAVVDRESDDFILSFLRYIKENKKTFRIMLVNNDNPFFAKKFINSAMQSVIASLRVNLDPKERDYIYTYLCNGSLAVLIRWIENDFDLDERTVLKILSTLATNGLSALAK